MGHRQPGRDRANRVGLRRGVPDVEQARCGKRSATGATWATIREDLQDLHVGVFTGPAGTFTQTSTPTPAARAALAALDIEPPKRILRLAPATTEPAEQATG
jgi:hypothetical protein